ncbi:MULTISPECIES: hypothetical protein [Pseudoalteromonas]|uniref:Uncharacterized protein n=1 Tax=Pseudoalteromonas amylolytica TaxID=1859457 RepID=A0A1S1N123_9GAMM|nr:MULTISPECIES: hypothetical protein [Pseudoalteromonas]OHU85514.1 hypothetical protein BFC16_19390 [Pseudoalteromonas sp. JW3]OHU91748.1 hypothetical protein BET10_08085 [Pseudoalteromonas amylolytica]
MNDVTYILKPVLESLEQVNAELELLTPEELALAQEMVAEYFKCEVEPVDGAKEALNFIIYNSIQQVVEAERGPTVLGKRPALPMLPLTSVLHKVKGKQDKLYDALLKTLTTLHSQAVAD